PAGWRPGAPTRSAYTWPARARHAWATRSTDPASLPGRCARRWPPPGWPARRCTPRCSASSTRSPGRRCASRVRCRRTWRRWSGDWIPSESGLGRALPGADLLVGRLQLLADGRPAARRRAQVFAAQVVHETVPEAGPALLQQLGADGELFG